MTRALTEVRTAVRDCVADLPPSSPVVVACSGGPDSVALAVATAWVCARQGRQAAAVVVDHDLVEGSEVVAASAAELCASLGLDPVLVRRVDARAHPGGPGPEAAAREVRYAALTSVAAELGAGAILLGHTLDDQAETVLLGLARGSGARSLAGMRPSSGLLRRPFLAIGRETVRRAARDAGLVSVVDPQNSDPRFARVRAREVVLPMLERELGPGIAEALARTAELLRDDADLLDSLAADARSRLGESPLVADLGALAPALRTRVIRLLIVEAGCPAGGLTRGHVLAVDHLLCEPRARGPVHLPDGYVARRTPRAGGRLSIERDPLPRERATKEP